jgi:hypothetical protein
MLASNTQFIRETCAAWSRKAGLVPGDKSLHNVYVAKVFVRKTKLPPHYAAQHARILIGTWNLIEAAYSLASGQSWIVDEVAHRSIFHTIGWIPHPYGELDTDWYNHSCNDWTTRPLMIHSERLSPSP